MNEFLATLPFDLYELSLFQLVAEHRQRSREVGRLCSPKVGLWMK